ncbi:MAG: hypothetical protein ACREQI_03200 [Candidatus Binataceae bacterium]
MRGTIAAACAVLILAAQLIGAVHFHQAPRSAQLSVNEGLCPICALAFHAPGSMSAAPAILCGPVPTEVAAIPELPAARSLAASFERGRAPPAPRLA